MSFVAGPLIDRFGKKPVLASGSLLCALALASISVAPSYKLLAMLVFAVGLGGSCINSGSNTLVPDLYPVNPSAALIATMLPWNVSLPELTAIAADRVLRRLTLRGATKLYQWQQQPYRRSRSRLEGQHMPSTNRGNLDDRRFDC
jgi:DHA1 family bicyclomycin/chloramphenicol resistance-like MFS transporter